MLSTVLADERNRPVLWEPEAGGKWVPGDWRSAGESGMHTIVLFERRSRHEAVLSAWLADAVRRGEKVLVLRATMRTLRCSTARSRQRVSTRAAWSGRVRWSCSTP